MTKAKPRNDPDAPFIYDPTLFLVACTDCTPHMGKASVIHLPFSSTEIRDAWIADHIDRRGHFAFEYQVVKLESWRGSNR